MAGSKPMNEEPNVNDMSLEDRVRYQYSHGNKQGIALSIQDIARVNRITVEEVLAMTGQTDLLSVQTTGDMIDQDEAGFNTQINHGERHRVTYSTN